MQLRCGAADGGGVVNQLSLFQLEFDPHYEAGRLLAGYRPRMQDCPMAKWETPSCYCVKSRSIQGCHIARIVDTYG